MQPPKTTTTTIPGPYFLQQKHCSCIPVPTTVSYSSFSHQKRRTLVHVPNTWFPSIPYQEHNVLIFL